MSNRWREVTKNNFNCLSATLVNRAVSLAGSTEDIENVFLSTIITFLSGNIIFQINPRIDHIPASLIFLEEQILMPQN